MEGHPDNVAPALMGGICLSVMHPSGTKTLTFPSPDKLQLRSCRTGFYTIMSSDFAQSSAANSLYERCCFQHQPHGAPCHALARGELSYLAYALKTKFTNLTDKKLIPGMEDAFASAKENGALGATISGAGPALMAYTTQNAGLIGQAMAKAFARKGKTSSLPYTPR